MITTPTTNDELLAENDQLRLRLEEAEAVVEAIRSGIVDAVVVSSTPGECVYTLEGADRPYRLLVEAMQQGVAVLNPEGAILYCNPCLADLLKLSVEKVTGCTVDRFAANTRPHPIDGPVVELRGGIGPTGGPAAPPRRHHVPGGHRRQRAAFAEILFAGH